MEEKDDENVEDYQIITVFYGFGGKKEGKKFVGLTKRLYICSVKGEANRRQTESNQACLNCRGAKKEGEAK